MSTTTVRILVCRVGRLPVVELLPPDADRPDSHLNGMQRIVGGTVSMVTLDDGLDCWHHDEGLLIGLPLNRAIPARPRGKPLIDPGFVIYLGDPETFAKPDEPGEWRIYGDFFLARCTEDGELASVTDDDVARYAKLFDQEDIAMAKRMNDLRASGVVS